VMCCVAQVRWLTCLAGPDGCPRCLHVREQSSPHAQAHRPRQRCRGLCIDPVQPVRPVEPQPYCV